MTSSPDNSEKLLRLASAPVGRLLWEYSLPAVIGMLVMALYNVVDRIFIGQVVGPDAIAGLTITFPVMNLSAAIGVLIGAGSTARISILLGQGNHAGAANVLGNALTLLIINATIYLSLFAIFIDPILKAFGASDVTLPYARSFMQAMLPGMLMMNLAFSFNNAMRASGYPVKAMFTMLLGAGLNVILDPIFIYWLDWGIAGAAIATDIAMTITAIWVLGHFLRRDVTLRFTRGTYRLRGPIVLSIVAIGSAPSLVNAAGSAINVIINHSLYAHGGDGSVATAGIFVTYTSMITSVILGLCMGMQPIIGYNYGAGRYGRLRHTFWLAATTATVICAVGTFFGIVTPGAIGRLFAKDPSLISDVSSALPRAMWAFVFVGLQIVATTLFQAIGQASRSIILSLVRQVVFLIPLLLTLPSVYGLNGVWLAFPTSDLFATVVTVALLWWLFRTMPSNARQQSHGPLPDPTQTL